MGDYLPITTDISVRPAIYNDEPEAPAFVAGPREPPQTVVQQTYPDNLVHSQGIPASIPTPEMPTFAPPVVVSVPIGEPVQGARDANTWANSTTPMFQLQGTGGGGSAVDWSSFPAKVNVDMDLNDLLEVPAITNTNTLDLQAGNDITVESALGDIILQANTGNVDITANDRVLIGGLIGTGIGGNEIVLAPTTQVRITKPIDMSGNRITNTADPSGNQDVATKYYVDTRPAPPTSTLANVLVAGNSAGATSINMNTNNIDNVSFINASTTTNIILNKDNALGSTLNDAVVVISAGATETTGLTDPMTTVLLKANKSAGTSEEITNLAFYGYDSDLKEAQYASITTNATDTTVSSTNAQMKLNVALNGTSSTLLVIDGSNNTVNANTILNMTSNRIINTTDPSGAQDVATKNYVDTRPASTLATVLLAGNSAGATNINMNGQDITNVNDITNTSGEINITGNDVNLSATGLTSVLNIGAVAGITLTSAGACTVNAVGAVQIGTAGLISIGSSADNTEIEKVKFAENVISKTSAGSNLVINDIAEFNTSTPNSVIQSKAGIAIIDLSGLSDFAGFQAQTLTASTNDVAGVIAQTLIATTGDAYGVIIGDIQAQAQQATGIIINGASGTTSSKAVHIMGPLTGTTQHGVYEDASGTNVRNTFMNNTGIGKDPSGVKLDVLGQTKITTADGGRAVPTLELTSTNATAPGTYLQFYHNSATPDIGDRVGVMDFYANSSTGVKREFARIRTLQDLITNGAESGEIEMSVIKGGSMTQTFTIDGSNSKVAIASSGMDITKDTSATAPHTQLLATNVSTVGIQEQVYRNVSLTTNDVVSTKSFFGNSSTGVKRELARAEITCRDNTNASEDTLFTTSVMKAGTLSVHQRIDGLYDTVAMGRLAGTNTGTAVEIVAIGVNAGVNCARNCVAIGNTAGQTNLPNYSTVIGNSAGRTGAGAVICCLGTSSGDSGCGIGALAIGSASGQTNLGREAVALGYDAVVSSTSATDKAVAIGFEAMKTNGRTNTVSIGARANVSNAGEKSIVIGAYTSAGNASSGTNSIAIGANAVNDSSTANSICLNATATKLSANQAGLFIDPIRTTAGNNMMMYNPTSKEVSSTASMSIDTNGNVIAGGSVALATTAVNGFLYVPTCAGTPTGTPTTITGMAPIVVDTTNNKLYFYSTGVWRDAGP